MSGEGSNHSVASSEADISHARALIRRGNFESALAAARVLQQRRGTEREGLYMVAVCLRYLGRIPEALETLTELEAANPGFSRLFQERGHCYVALHQAEPAIESFVRAVNLNPLMPASWNSLTRLFRITGRLRDAEFAGAEAARLASIPQEILTAWGLFADGNVPAAEGIARSYLRIHGDHTDAMRLLAKIAMKLDVSDDAELLLEKAVKLVPDDRPLRYDYARVLLTRQKHLAARDEILRLLAIDSANRAYRTTYATICAGLGDYSEAIPLYREILLETPDDAELHLSIGHCLKTIASTDEAIKSYRVAASVRPGFGEAYWSLANLKTYRFAKAEISQMKAFEAAPRTSLVDRYHLCFALGKALEGHADYATSFGYYERGNALKKAECRYRAEVLERSARLQTEVCTREFFERHAGAGSASVSPIFIVGLPRSGSTLIEQILASHSEVEGTMELANIPRLAQELGGRDRVAATPRYPGVLDEMSAEDFCPLGERYIRETAVYRTGKPFFVDKMPNNFRHLGLIHLILPKAKIIDVRREALACCFSNYKQLFASGQQFTYSFDDIARYYRMYVELMGHWNRAIPAQILRVDHEAMVADLEAGVRRILEFCELPFERDCLEFYKNKRSVHSASSEQVRRPITADGLDSWRHFKPWLAPLKAALGDLASL